MPTGVRVYAVGDIHGRLDNLKTLLGMIEDIEEALSADRAILVFLGDYVDRGAESSGVIEHLLNGLPDRFEKVFLRGNHEEMMLQALGDIEFFDFWASNGGIATARSYGVDIPDGTRLHELDVQSIQQQLVDLVPQSHKDFLKALPIKAEAGDYLFVHAGVRPNVPLDAQIDRDCLLIRDEFLNYKGNFGKVVVHGHTPVREPESLHNRVGIDTGAFQTGCLTAVCLEDQSRRFISTNTNARRDREDIMLAAQRSER